MADSVSLPPARGDRLMLEGRLYEVVDDPRFDDDAATWSMTLHDVEYAAQVNRLNHLFDPEESDADA